MAKISANGAREVARFRLKSSGTTFLVRSDGVVLWKSSVPGDGWKVHTRYRAAGVEAVVRWYRSRAGFEEATR